jgi:hypothetical protein
MERAENVTYPKFVPICQSILPVPADKGAERPDHTKTIKTEAIQGTSLGWPFLFLK